MHTAASFNVLSAIATLAIDAEWHETRWVIAVTTIQHDLCNAGEINHLRSLHQRNNQWE